MSDFQVKVNRAPAPITSVQLLSTNRMTSLAVHKVGDGRFTVEPKSYTASIDVEDLCAFARALIEFANQELGS